jgi:uncharacterized repeat protein (TIGR03809 family)
MTDEQPLRRFNKTAEKWRDLAEKRRLYFEELHQTGRWKYYYTEAQFYQRLGKAAELVELWEPVLKARIMELPAAAKSPAMSPAISAPTSSSNSPSKFSSKPSPTSPSPMSLPKPSPAPSTRPVAPPRRRAS